MNVFKLLRNIYFYFHVRLRTTADLDIREAGSNACFAFQLLINHDISFFHCSSRLIAVCVQRQPEAPSLITIHNCMNQKNTHGHVGDAETRKCLAFCFKRDSKINPLLTNCVNSESWPCGFALSGINILEHTITPMSAPKQPDWVR